MYEHWRQFDQKPPALENRPKLTAHLIPYYDAFQVLKNQRTRSEAGMNPIAYSEMVAYAKHNGLGNNQEMLEYFVELVQAMDIEYVNYSDQKRMEAMKAAQRKVSRTRN